MSFIPASFKTFTSGVDIHHFERLSSKLMRIFELQLEYQNRIRSISP